MVTVNSSGAPEAAPPWVRRPANLASAVATELVQRIVSGIHPPGSVLPAEPALCEAFSVSRTVIREAVKMLQEKGLVQVRQGAGTTITPADQWSILDELVLSATIAQDDDLSTLDDLVVTRRLLESDMAHVAAQRASPDVIQQLGALVDLMDTLVGDRLAYGDQDRNFHDVIMRASGNRIARGVVRAFENQVGGSARYLGRSERSLRTQCEDSNRGHRRIYERIAARDPAGAADAMFTHITEAWLVRRDSRTPPDRLQR